MGHLPIYFLAVADLPPGDGFPQAGAAGRGANPALVMERRCQGMGGGDRRVGIARTAPDFGGILKSLPGPGTI